MPRALLPPPWMHNISFLYIFCWEMHIFYYYRHQICYVSAGGNPRQVCLTPYADFETLAYIITNIESLS